MKTLNFELPQIIALVIFSLVIVKIILEIRKNKFA